MNVVGPSSIVRVGLVVFLLGGAGCSHRPSEPPPAPQTTQELEKRIRDVLDSNRVPGAGVVLVSRKRVLWVTGLGTADRAAATPVTTDTRFRVGSITKSFVALAVLKLQEEGRLRLEDRLRDRAPEISFSNPWEDSDPVLLVHLLEHTSGMDDLSLGEHAHN